MYKVERKNGKIFVVNAEDKPVWASPEDGYIVYRRMVMNVDTVVAERVDSMKDEQLLVAIANSVKLGN